MLDQALFLILILKISTLMIHEDPVKLLFTVLKSNTFGEYRRRNRHRPDIDSVYEGE